MKTFLLHGGRTSKDDPSNVKFFSKFTSLVHKKEVHILLCYWAREKDQWQLLRKKQVDKVNANTEKKTSFRLVNTPKELFDLLPSADVLYVMGGSAVLLEPYYKDLSDLGGFLDNKIYIGDSMGAFMVSDSYVLSFDKQQSNSVHEGLGLLPIQTLCHWDIEKKKAKKLSMLEKHSNNPIITLDECEFVTFYT